MRRAVVISVLVLLTWKLSAQCGAGTPEFVVDLSANPNAAWISPDTVRMDTCCGATSPDVCVAFIVTLHPLAEGIIFDVCDGAMPGGALFYQVSCGPAQAVGEALCLSGPGPHYITFCKPGNNQNKYCITSVSEPVPGPDIAVNDGCYGQLYVSGYDPASLQWTSVSPGAAGTYNSYLDCTMGCDTVNVTGQAMAPDSVLYQVCGLLLGDCDTGYYCDTIAAYFYSTLQSIIQPEQPTVCFGATGTYLYATGGGGYPPYNFQWSTGSTSDSIFVNVGTYYLTVSDNTGCPPAYDTVTVTAFASTIEAFAGADTMVCINSLPFTLGGSVVAATGGRWIGAGGTFAPDSLTLNAAYTPTPAEVSAGFSELVLITTGNGSCPPDTDTVHITWHKFTTVPLFGTSDVTCNGLSDGAANLQVVSGMGLSSAVWGSTPVQNGFSAINLAAGNYTVILTDSLGCDSIFSISITEPPLLVHTLDTIVDASCNGYADGSITVAASGGISPYVYTWSNAATGNINPGLSAGTYSVIVTDSNGCADTGSYTVAEPAPIVIAIDTTDVLCTGGNSGVLLANVTGAFGTVTYLWSNGGTAASATALTAGQYEVTVTYGNACVDSATAVVDEPDSLTLLLTPVDVTCSGASDGTIGTTVGGGLPGYSYTWSNGAGNLASQAGLAPGTYTVTVSDVNSCTVQGTASITEPVALTLTTTPENITCNGYANGSISALAAGGTLPYSFLWSDGSTSAALSSLDTGLYVLVLTDSNGCTVSDSVQITEPALLDVTLTPVNVQCYGQNTGALTSATMGGTAPYNYLWSTSATTANINLLPAGMYAVTVTDSNNCQDTVSQVITQPDSLTLVLAEADISCFGADDGSIIATVGGGVPNYTYTWSNGAGNVSAISALAPGTYSLTVTDDNVCTILATVSITEPAALILTATPENITCNGYADGSITTSVTGGTEPYSFQWSNGSSDTAVYTLAPGTYTLTLSDLNGCTASSTLQITEPNALSGALVLTNVACYGGNTGTLISNVSGGTTPYVYSWSNAATTANLTQLTAGTYTLTVTDSNGCQDTVAEVVSQPDSLSLGLTYTDVTCFGAGDGTISTAVQGGVPAYVYNWSTGASGTSLSNLGPGSYSLTVADQNNCELFATILISEPGPLWINAMAENVHCSGNSDGSIVTGVSGGNAPYTYSWSTGGSGANLPNLPVGTYSLTVTDIKGCVHDTVINITQPPALQLSLSLGHISCFDGNDGVIHANASGGTLPYQYNWSNSSSVTDSAVALPAGYHAVTVTDAEGCTLAANATLLQPAMITVQLSQNETICLNTTATIQATAAGGNGGYGYQWSQGLPDQPAHVVAPTVSTTYSVTVTDSVGCPPATGSVKVVVKPVVFDDLNLNLRPGAICEGGSALISGTYTGDPTGYTFLWNNGLGTQPGSFTVNPVATTTYTLSVIDECGFDTTASVTLVVNPTPVVNFPEILAEGCAPFKTTLSVDAGGISIASYTWKLGNAQTSSEASPTVVYHQPGEYTVSVTLVSDKGCKATGATTGKVIVRRPPDADFTVTPERTDTDHPDVETGNLSQRANSYVWNISDGARYVATDIHHTFADYGVYNIELIAVDEFGCTDTAVRQVIVDPVLLFEAPDAFTPNTNGSGGGYYDPSAMNNDIFYLITDYVEKFRLLVYNRWGEVVFETFDPRQGWDGYYKGGLAPIGMYVWRADVTYVTGKEVTEVGNVTLLR